MVRCFDDPYLIDRNFRIYYRPAMSRVGLRLPACRWTVRSMAC
jgi:hypothetical protein